VYPNMLCWSDKEKVFHIDEADWYNNIMFWHKIDKSGKEHVIEVHLLVVIAPDSILYCDGCWRSLIIHNIRPDTVVAVLGHGV